MPYIKQENRGDITDALDSVSPNNVGELNFAITKLIQNYIGYTGLRYDVLNGVIGVLEASKLELYRRMVAPYEDAKIKENGDVY